MATLDLPALRAELKRLEPIKRRTEQAFDDHWLNCEACLVAGADGAEPEDLCQVGAPLLRAMDAAQGAYWDVAHQNVAAKRAE